MVFPNVEVYSVGEQKDMTKLKEVHDAQLMELEERRHVLQKNQRELEALNETLRQVWKKINDEIMEQRKGRC